MIELATDQIQVGIVTRNAEAMLTFYGKTLGLTMQPRIDVPEMGSLYFFELGSNIIKLMVPDFPVEHSNASGLPYQSTGLRYWTVQVNNIDTLVADIKKHGLAPLTEIDQIGDIRFVIVTDPDGNCIELLEMAAA
jgi:predicted enzyme related to lactoylglutathione lyase